MRDMAVSNVDIFSIKATVVYAIPCKITLVIPSRVNLRTAEHDNADAEHKVNNMESKHE